MSLILDALNRSRRERSAVPGLDTEHAVSAIPDSPWRRYLPWAGLALAAIVIAWLLLDRGNGEGEQSVAAVAPAAEQPGAGGGVFVRQSGEAGEGSAAPAADKPEKKPQQVERADAGAAKKQSRPTLSAGPGEPASPSGKQRKNANKKNANKKKAKSRTAAGKPAAENSVTQGDDSATATADAQDEIADLYARNRQLPDTAPVPEPATAPASAGRPTANAAPAEPVKPTKPTESAVAAVREEPIDVEKMLIQAREEMANERLVDHPVPFLSSLSQQVKDKVPTVLYQRHDYSERNPSVVLNGKTLRVGGSPGSGIKVREILPDSVILEHGGVKFRLRALNSWVNL